MQRAGGSLDHRFSSLVGQPDAPVEAGWRTAEGHLPIRDVERVVLVGVDVLAEPPSSGDLDDRERERALMC
jgi:hypothetical protein